MISSNNSFYRIIRLLAVASNTCHMLIFSMVRVGNENTDILSLTKMNFMKPCKKRKIRKRERKTEGVM
jgi:hypothetical protein